MNPVRRQRPTHAVAGFQAIGRVAVCCVAAGIADAHDNHTTIAEIASPILRIKNSRTALAVRYFKRLQFCLPAPAVPAGRRRQRAHT